MNELKLEPSEHAEYHGNYIKHIHAVTLKEVLGADLPTRDSFFTKVKEDDHLEAYAAGKWTVKESLVHCVDTERIFTARALKIARGEELPLSGYDHVAYAKCSKAELRTLENIGAEWRALRNSTALLFENFDELTQKRACLVSGNRVSVRAIAFIIAGHSLHHFEILKTRYGLRF